MKKLLSVLLIAILILTAIPTNHVSAAKKYNENLTAGEYLVGDDIPAGKYNVSGIKEWGMIYIYTNEDDYDKNKYLFRKLLSICSKERSEDLAGIYSVAYKNLKLKKGYYVVIENDLTVNFKAK